MLIHAEPLHFKISLALLEGYLDIGKDDNVLEVGYGRGDFGRHLIERGHDYEGIDASIEHYNYCKEKSPNDYFEHGDFYEARGHCPRIFSNEVLVHVKSHPNFFKKCASLQNKGDKIVTKEMHIPHLGAIDPFTCNFRLNPIFDWTGEYHTLEQDIKWQQEAGYKVEVVEWDINNYVRTLTVWIAVMKEKKEELIKMMGKIRYYKTVDTWKVFRDLQLKGKYSENIMIATKL